MVKENPEVDRLWKISAAAAKNLQRIADELGKAAENWEKLGGGNPERDQELWHSHHEALEQVIRVHEELEKAAIAAGIIPPKN